MHDAFWNIISANYGTNITQTVNCCSTSLKICMSIHAKDTFRPFPSHKKHQGCALSEFLYSQPTECEIIHNIHQYFPVMCFKGLLGTPWRMLNIGLCQKTQVMLPPRVHKGWTKTTEFRVAHTHLHQFTNEKKQPLIQLQVGNIGMTTLKQHQ